MQLASHHAAQQDTSMQSQCMYCALHAYKTLYNGIHRSRLGRNESKTGFKKINGGLWNLKQARASEELLRNNHAYIRITPTQHLASVALLSQDVLTRQACAQEGVGVAVGGAHLLLGDGWDGLVRQVLQDCAAPGDEAAVPCRLRRRPIVQTSLHVTKGWFTLVRPSGPVWAFGPGYRTAGRHGKSWASRPARRLSRPSNVWPLPLVRMACRADNHYNLVSGMQAFWRLSFTVVLTRIWTRIKANGRPFPSATPSSPSFSDTRAIFRSDIPDICRPISMDTGVTIWKWKHWWKRWRMISKQPKMILSMQPSEVQSFTLQPVKFNLVISCWLKNFLSALIHGIEVYCYGYTK